MEHLPKTAGASISSRLVAQDVVTQHSQPFRRPTSLQQALWGGKACPVCGTEMDDGDGKSTLAPINPAQPTKKRQFEKWALNQLCSTSPEQEIVSSMVDGGVSGTVAGALEGGIFGTIFSAPIGGIGGIPAAGVGGFIGGVFGATNGVIQGAEMAGVCSLFHVY
jgi:hypothetical protein